MPQIQDSETMCRPWNRQAASLRKTRFWVCGVQEFHVGDLDVLAFDLSQENDIAKCDDGSPCSEPVRKIRTYKMTHCDSSIGSMGSLAQRGEIILPG
ncbi:hypothetical protein AVEN_96151-1 [Araneus ventricosus]|uniref:Uncharacterized protein n=1 Tax=Araneus ventricosus TaxID=182803 RepID=A0A4Y2ME75_ARAVE|nr:hypothetical protein AVEN_96151-1 [Araneus ventricosus]